MPDATPARPPDADDPARRGAEVDAELSRQDAVVTLLHERVALARRVDDVPRAEACLHAILALRPADLRAINTLGWMYEHRGRHDDAAREYERLIELARDDPGWRTVGLGNLGMAVATRGDRASMRRAADLHREALALARQAGRARHQAEQLCNLGDLERTLGNLDEAEACQRQMIDIYTDVLGEPRNACSGIANLGSIQLDRGDAGAATALLRRALDLTDESIDRAACLADLCSAALTRDPPDLPDARRCCARALRIDRGLARPEGLATGLGHAGRIALAEGDPARATGLYRRALLIDRARGFLHLEATHVLYLADVQRARGELKMAYDAALWAYETFEDSGHQLRTTEAAVSLGRTAAASGDVPLARRWWTDGRDRSGRHGYARLARDLDGLLAATVDGRPGGERSQLDSNQRPVD